MNTEDLKYLREMAEMSGSVDFSNEDLEKVGEALRTNVDASDTTEALDLTAEIIYQQSQYTNQWGNDRNVDIEKLHDLTKEVIYHGELLGAEDALKKVDDFDFIMDVRRENVTDKNANRKDSFGHSFLEASLYCSKSPKAIEAIIGKGGKFSEEEHPSEVVNMLLERVTFGYNDELEEFGENSIKNTLGNLAVLIETGLIEKPKDLDRLISNPILFEKYPDEMNKLFEGDKDLPRKLENMRAREHNKETTDYLQDKSDDLRAAIHRIKMRQRRGERRVLHSDRDGETGNSLTGEVNASHQKIAERRTESYLNKMSERDDNIGERTRKYLQKNGIGR